MKPEGGFVGRSSELVSSRWSHGGMATLRRMTSWRELAAWHRSAREACAEQWSVFAPLSSGVLTALGAGSEFAAENWGATAFFAVLTATFSIVGIRNFFALNR
jgi:hypothetical protein